MELNKILNSDCIAGMKTMPEKSVQCCVTSPPYFGLRDYGHDGQIGLEATPEMYVEKMVEVFREVKRVLKDDGTLWLNIGDSYNGSGAGGGTGTKSPKMKAAIYQGKHTNATNVCGLKPKDLIGIPWMLAFALRADGWYLRQDIIWHKPNPMPESVTDRCTKAHEYIFLLSKSSKYYYDAEAIKQPAKDVSIARMDRGVSDSHKNVNGAPGQAPHSMMQPRENKNKSRKYKEQEVIGKKLSNHSGGFYEDGTVVGGGMANKRSVWSVTTKPFREAHFATFPEDLITDCIKAGCPQEGVVLDPFMGAGTTALVSTKLNRNFIGFELNIEYIKIAQKRLQSALGLFSKI